MEDSEFQRGADYRVLEDLRHALQYVRSALDELARSDAVNSEAVQTLKSQGRDMERRLKKDIEDLERRLDLRHSELVTWLQQVESKVDGSSQAGSRLAGGWETLWKGIAALGVLGALVVGAVKVAQVMG